ARLQFISLLLRRPVCTSPSPYTTLFRSRLPMILMRNSNLFFKISDYEKCKTKAGKSVTHGSIQIHISYSDRIFGTERKNSIYQRSEEHTSELQSRENLVCRLLHGKNNKK